MNHDEKSTLLYEVPCQSCLVYTVYRTNQTGLQIQNYRISTSNKTSTVREISSLPAFDGKHHLIDWSDVKTLKVEHDLTWKPHIVAISIKVAGGSWALTRLKDIC